MYKHINAYIRFYTDGSSNSICQTEPDMLNLIESSADYIYLESFMDYLDYLPDLISIKLLKYFKCKTTWSAKLEVVLYLNYAHGLNQVRSRSGS